MNVSADVRLWHLLPTNRLHIQEIVDALVLFFPLTEKMLVLGLKDMCKLIYNIAFHERLPCKHIFTNDLRDKFLTVSEI